MSERTTAEESVLEALRAAADAVAVLAPGSSMLVAALAAVERAYVDVETTFDAHRMVRQQRDEAVDAVRRLKATLQRERAEKRVEPARADEALAEAAASRLIQAMEVSSRVPSWFLGIRRDGSRMHATVLLRSEEEPVEVPVLVRSSRNAAHRLRVTLPEDCAVVTVAVEDDADGLVAHAVSEVARAARARAERGGDG